VVNAIFGGHRS
jgi:hypothetical protein